MSRNEEKNQSMLYRFREAELAERTGIEVKLIRGGRPKHTKMVDNVLDAERWRGSVIREIARKVNRIHDPGLNEGQVREVNDSINNLFKEKWQWEKRMAELGGPDYTKMAESNKIFSKEIPGIRGYKYFGRARELPEVKEYLDALSRPPAKFKVDKSKLDAEYYGYLISQKVKDHEKQMEQEFLVEFDEFDVDKVTKYLWDFDL